MKYSKKILLTGLCAVLYFTTPDTAIAATAEEGPTPVMAPVAKQRVPFRFMAAEEQATGCQSCWRGFGRCLKKTKGYLKELGPILEVALTFIKDEEVRGHAQTAIKLLKKGSKHVEVDEEGNITFLKGDLKGQTIANALMLVVNDKAELLTDESEMMLSLVLSQLSEGNIEDKIKFIGFLAASDNPDTSFHITFNADTGHVGLAKGKSLVPIKYVGLFEDGMADETKNVLRAYFAEYTRAVDERTKAEAASDGVRSTAIYLPKDGKVLKDYETLVSTNPNFELVKIAEEVIRGDKSVVAALEDVAGSTA